MLKNSFSATTSAQTRTGTTDFSDKNLNWNSVPYPGVGPPSAGMDRKLLRRRRCVLGCASRIINAMGLTALLNHLHEQQFLPVACFRQTLFDETPLKLCVDENGAPHRILRGGRPATCKILQIQLRVAVLMKRETDEHVDGDPTFKLFIYRFVAPLQMFPEGLVKCICRAAHRSCTESMDPRPSRNPSSANILSAHSAYDHCG